MELKASPKRSSNQTRDFGGGWSEQSFNSVKFSGQVNWNFTRLQVEGTVA